MQPPHVLFAGDCLIVARAQIQDAIYLAAVLDVYCSGSGQSINFGKSSIIFSPSTPLHVKHQIRALLNIFAARST